MLPSHAVGGGLWQLAAAVDVIDYEELSFGKLLGAGAAGASGWSSFLQSQPTTWWGCLRWQLACSFSNSTSDLSRVVDQFAWLVHTPWPAVDRLTARLRLTVPRACAVLPQPHN
jgi:hypothetical protein